MQDCKQSRHILQVHAEHRGEGGWCLAPDAGGVTMKDAMLIPKQESQNE